LDGGAGGDDDGHKELYFKPDTFFAEREAFSIAGPEE